MRTRDTLSILATGIGLFAVVSCGSNSKDTPLTSDTVTQSGASTADAMLSQGRALQAAGKNGKAISIYKKIYKKYPYADAAAEALFEQGQILDQKGDLIKAFDAYQNVIGRYHGSRHYKTALNRQEAVAHAAANGIIKNSFLGMKTRISPQKVEKMLLNVRDNAPRAASAPKAQYAIGRVWQEEGNSSRAIAAYQQVGLEYPSSSEAPEALYQQGEILVLKAKRGNQNTAHVDRARDIYQELIQRYSSHSRAADARKRLAMLGGQDVQRSYETGEFYRKKGQNKAAIFYYREVLRKTKSGSHYDLAKQRISELGG